MNTIETTISGIPCMIRFSYTYTKPDRSTDISAEDYSGGYVIAWEPTDRAGKYAPWLERKLTDQARARIEQEIISTL